MIITLLIWNQGKLKTFNTQICLRLLRISDGGSDSSMSDGLPLHLQYMADSISAKKKKLKTRKERDKLQTQRSASFRDDRRTNKLEKLNVKLLNNKALICKIDSSKKKKNSYRRQQLQSIQEPEKRWNSQSQEYV